MKFLLLISCCLLPLCNLANARQWAVAPADTVAGQAQLVNQLAAAACKTMDSGASRAATLSATQAQEAFETALSDAIENNIANIRQVAHRAKAAGAYEQLRANLPTATALQLVKTCGTAAVLYGRFSSTITSAPAPSAAETAFVQSWGDELCQRLAALNEKGQFQGKTSTERVALFHREYTASLTTRGSQIMQLYGTAGNSQQVTKLLSDRMAAYMEQHCPQNLLLLNADK